MAADKRPLDGRANKAPRVAHVLQRWKGYARLAREEYLDKQFYIAFKISKGSMEELCRELSDDLHREGCNLKRPIPVSEIVPMCVKLLTTGSFQTVVECLHGWSQPSVLKQFGCFLAAVLAKKEKYVRLPNAAEKYQIKKRIWETYGIPNIIGTIDGTNVKVKVPPTSRALYVNYKCYPSITNLVCTDDNLRFYYVWTGNNWTCLVRLATIFLHLCLLHCLTHASSCHAAELGAQNDQG